MKNFITSLIILLSFSTNIFSQEDETRSTHVKIERLLFLIEQMYVEEIDNNSLREDLVTGMLNSLRPFSIYQNEDFFIAHIIPKNKSIQSAGFSLNFKGGKIKVDSIYKGSGAELAKLSKGDEIIELDGNNLDEVYYYSDLLNLLVGEKNSIIKTKYVRTIESQNEDEGKVLDTIETTILRKEIDGLHVLPIGIKNNIDLNLISQYSQALNIFDELYPDSITNTTITENGIRYMLEQLDPHSTYVSLKDMHDMNAPLKGSFSGVGIRFQVLKDTIMVVQAIPGGPSEKVGIMAGDKMVKIQDETVAGIGISTVGVRDRLLGDKGTVVNVSIKRGVSNELIDFSIERDKIPIYSVDASYMASPETGYIKLNNFSSTSLAEIRQAVLGLKSNGMENLILDLQNNGGGYLRTAVELADELLAGNNKKIVSTKGRKFPEKSYKTNRKGLLENGKIIVLVNESSASASEIVSGAIQDWDRGLIVGRRTFGKGLVQKPIDLPDNSQVRITTSKYYTPSGRCIQKAYEGGSVAYRREKYERYNSGESFSVDSIKQDKEDIYLTKVKKRKVYGGGGIMPDHFVALDTSGTSSYFNKLIRKGIFNQFALSWVNNNRKTLEKKYPTFNLYNKNFSSKKIMNELIEYAENEGLEYNKEEFLKAENTIHIRLKANIAQDLFDYKRFYQVINALNTSLQEALELMKNDENFKNLSYNK